MLTVVYTAIRSQPASQVVYMIKEDEFEADEEKLGVPKGTVISRLACSTWNELKAFEDDDALAAALQCLVEDLPSRSVLDIKEVTPCMDGFKVPDDYVVRATYVVVDP